MNRGFLNSPPWWKLSPQLLAVSGLAVALTACGGGNSGGGNTDTTVPVTTATPAGEAYGSSQSITLNCSDSGSGCAVTYYYTTDGTTPPPSSSITYTGTISIDAEGATALRFFSIDKAGNREAWQTQTYLLGSVPPVTTATPAGGVYASAQSVTLDCIDAGSGCAVTYYTADGTTPNTSSNVYSGAVIINTEGATELKFFSVDNLGSAEVVQTETYAIDTVASTTTITPASGIYTSTQSVTLGCTDTGSGCTAIYYTTDGTDPTTASSQYTAALSISTSTALKFFSVDSANNNEAVQTQIYSIPSPLASGMYNSVFLRGDGTAWAWGLNQEGQLGDGTAPNDSPVPVQVINLTAVTAITSNGHHSLAIKNDSTVWAWGGNSQGQLGDGNAPTDSSIPVPVSGAGFTGTLANVTAIATGRWHSLAIDTSGTVWSWGGNSQGQSGQGMLTAWNTAAAPGQVCDNAATAPCSSTDANVLTDVAAIASGFWYSLALKNDGTVWTWGGQLDGSGSPGTPPTTGSTTPVPVSGLSDVIAISGGRDHALALKRDGTLWAWGENAYGQLGDGNPSTDSALPVQVVLSNVIAIGAGREHSLALKRDGTVWAWGRNFDGELGDGKSATNIPTSAFDAGATAPRGISYASGGTLWIADTGSDRIYHINTNGTLISSFPTSTFDPVANDTRSIAYAPDDTLWVTDHFTDKVYNISSTGTWISEFPITVYDAAGTMVQGITYDTSDDTLWVINHEPENRIYNINTDGTSIRSFPTTSFDPASIIVWDISYDSATDTLWVTDSGTGKIYNIGKDGAPISEFPASGAGAYDSAATSSQGISYAPDGTLWVVDMNTDKFYHLPIVTGLPVQVLDVTGTGTLGGVVAIGGGMGHSAHSLALDSSGTIWAWGRNGNGELGNNTTTSSSTPVQVSPF